MEVEFTVAGSVLVQILEIVTPCDLHWKTRGYVLITKNNRKTGLK